MASLTRTYKERRWRYRSHVPPTWFMPVKGSVHVTISRAFADYVLHNDTATEILNWVRRLDFFQDEAFFSTLNHNPQLGIPGSYKGLCIVKQIYILFLYLSVCLCAYLSVSLPACLSVCKSVWLPANLFICLSACLPAWMSACLSVCISVWLSACLLICLPTCLKNLHVCLSVCLSDYHIKSVTAVVLFKSLPLAWLVFLSTYNQSETRLNDIAEHI